MLLRKGDQYRILAEFSNGEPQNKWAECGQMAYKKAVLLADELGPAHPVRLRAVMNFSNTVQ